jgi:cytoskeleton-associated protein 5
VHVYFHCTNVLFSFFYFQTNVRSTVVASLNAWADNCGVKEFFQGEMIADALKGQSPMLRTELFNWMAIRLSDGKLHH